MLVPPRLEVVRDDEDEMPRFVPLGQAPHKLIRAPQGIAQQPRERPLEFGKTTSGFEVHKSRYLLERLALISANHLKHLLTTRRVGHSGSHRRQTFGFESRGRCCFHVVNVGAVPEFEHEERPKLRRMIPPPVLVFVEQRLDVTRLDVTALARARLAERFAYAPAQLVVNPLLDGHAEALLGPVQNFRRHEVAHRALEDVLRLKAAHLQRGGDARDELYQLLVEQRHARFERGGHAHPVNLRQDVAGQVRLAVNVEQFVERFAGADSSGVLLKTQRGEVVAGKLAAEIFRVEQKPVGLCEDGDAVEITFDGVERDVVQVVAPARAVWKARAQGLHDPAAQEAREAREAAPFGVGDVARVSGEQFVSAVAGEHDGDVLARELRDHVGRDGGRVGERLVEVPDEFVNDVADVRRDDELRVLRAETLGGEARVLQFVVAVFAEAYREGLDGSVGVARHQADDRARINAAGEERAERHVRDQTYAHGLVKQPAKLFDIFLFPSR